MNLGNIKYLTTLDNQYICLISKTLFYPLKMASQSLCRVYPLDGAPHDVHVNLRSLALGRMRIECLYQWLSEDDDIMLSSVSIKAVHLSPAEAPPNYANAPSFPGKILVYITARHDEEDELYGTDWNLRGVDIFPDYSDVVSSNALDAFVRRYRDDMFLEPPEGVSRETLLEMFERAKAAAHEAAGVR